MSSLHDCRIVFMGTPEFAVATLDYLYKNGCNIVGVVTAPDKPAGRGMQLSESAVKKYASENGLNILQPVKLKDPEFLDQLRSLRADVQVVVAFRMLPEVVWNMPPRGTINLHGSLLPAYRGAAPINWAIINGELETGVTTFKLQQEIDTGDVLMSEKIPIAETLTAGELHDQMKFIGARIMYKTLEGYCSNTLVPLPQYKMITGPAEILSAPKLTTETGNINWESTAKKIVDLVRGLSPYPTAYTLLDKKKLKIFRSSYSLTEMSQSAGVYQSDGKTYLRFAALDGWVYIHDLQLEGKKRMDIESFLRGYRFNNADQGV
jgi:methionyl-tRNA formyltransferase